MLALEAVSDEIHKYDMVKDRLRGREYKGPQCFAHLDKKSADCRVAANEKAGEEEEQGAVGAGTGREAVLDPACWMRCDREGCGRWRLVDKNCLRCFRAECHFRETETDRDWAWWLQQAPSRYQRFLRRHMCTVGGSEEACLDGVLRSDAASAGQSDVAGAAREEDGGTALPEDSSESGARTASDWEEASGDDLDRLTRVSKKQAAKKRRRVKRQLAEAVAGMRGAATRRAVMAPDLVPEDVEAQREAEVCEDASSEEVSEVDVGAVCDARRAYTRRGPRGARQHPRGRRQAPLPRRSACGRSPP